MKPGFLALLCVLLLQTINCVLKQRECPRPVEFFFRAQIRRPVPNVRLLGSTCIEWNELLLASSPLSILGRVLADDEITN